MNSVESKMKHMDFIQGIINRMAGNSFALKGWAVTLVAALFALSHNETNKIYFIITYIPIIVFWELDAYYLLQERLFRSLYNKVRKLDENEIDFNMDISLDEFKNKKNTYWSCFKSNTVFWF